MNDSILFHMCMDCDSGLKFDTRLNMGVRW